MFNDNLRYEQIIQKLKKELEDLKLINKINIAMDKGEQIKDIIKSLKEQKDE